MAESNLIRSLVARPPLVLGIDGGATSTIAILADSDSGRRLGRGVAGPSNIQAVGVDAALRQLNLAIGQAFETANDERRAVSAACLGLAGIDLNEGVELIRGWGADVGLAASISVANDATLLFAATTAGWGLAVIAGTGSIAFTLDQEGREGRAGGWGYFLGDEGSAFRLGMSGLRAACRSADNAAPPTILLNAFLRELNTTDPRDFIPAVYRGTWDKAAIAGMAPIILEAALTLDPTAARIVTHEARELAHTAASAVANSNLPTENLPIALAGGLLLKSDSFRHQFLDHLSERGILPGTLSLVEEPAQGAVALARKMVAERTEDR